MKLTLDFDEETVGIETPTQKSLEIVRGLAGRKSAVMEAVGICEFDLTEETSAVNRYLNGEIDAKTLSEILLPTQRGKT